MLDLLPLGHLEREAIPGKLVLEDTLPLATVEDAFDDVITLWKWVDVGWLPVIPCHVSNLLWQCIVLGDLLLP